MQTENKNKIDSAVVSFENPNNDEKIIYTFTEYEEGIDMKVETQNIEEDTVPGLSGKLALLFMDFCSEKFGEAEDESKN